jgi:hypothetical protein
MLHNSGALRQLARSVVRQDLPLAILCPARDAGNDWIDHDCRNGGQIRGSIVGSSSGVHYTAQPGGKHGAPWETILELSW